MQNYRSQNIPDGERMKKRLPIAIVIDKSASTADIRPNMNLYARNLLSRLQDNLIFRGIVELLVVFYNGRIYCGKDGKTPPVFKPLKDVTPEDVSISESSGTTHTGLALLYAIEKLNQKKREWGDRGEQYYQPMLFLLTDGYPDAGQGAPLKVTLDYEERYQKAAETIRTLEQRKKLTFIAAGIQIENSPYRADMNRLKELSSHPEYIKEVTEGVDAHDKHEIDNFFSMIFEMTNRAYNSDQTPIINVINDIYGKV